MLIRVNTELLAVFNKALRGRSFVILSTSESPHATPVFGNDLPAANFMVRYSNPKNPRSISPDDLYVDRHIILVFSAHPGMKSSVELPPTLLLEFREDHIRCLNSRVIQNNLRTYMKDYGLDCLNHRSGFRLTSNLTHILIEPTLADMMLVGHLGSVLSTAMPDKLNTVQTTADNQSRYGLNMADIMSGPAKADLA